MARTNLGIHVTTPVTRRRPGVPGFQVNGGNPTDVKITAINKDPQQTQSDTITIDAAADNTTYTVSINGVEVSYTSGAGATTTTVAAGLAAALNSSVFVRGILTAEAAVAVITLTGNWPGIEYELTESHASISIASVRAADTADDVPFGRFTIKTGIETDSHGGDQLAVLAKSTSLTAQADSYVLTYDAAVQYVVTIKMEGQTYEGSVFGLVDLDTTGAALAADLNAKLPANTVVVTYTAGTDTLLLTSELAGKAFESAVTFRAPSGAAVDTGTATKTTNSSSMLTDVNRAACGITLITYEAENRTIGGDAPGYIGNAGMLVLQKGEVWVESSQSPSQGDPVYVELDGSGSNAGKLYTATSATRALLTCAKWVRPAYSGSDASVSVVHMDCPRD